ncbi:hypothetical protein [Streptomyces canus]|uniref:hypothetical protein n=1 Tax=Streptomyces canus TaxID=58343 RepID=UPI002E28369E|nr:hypothetical protein [Streptomyces canus]
MPEDQYAPVDEGVDHVQGIVALLWTPSSAQVWISTPRLMPTNISAAPTVGLNG